ncbi:hypothetical protein Tco_0846856, partial [Tanacetum coccineum]
MQRERAAQEEASNAALIAEFDDVQARMDADALLAARLQEEERDSFSIDEQARFLVEIIAKRKRFTYNQLKNKSLEEIKKLYEREQKWINDFIPMDSEMVKDSGKKDDDRDDIAINVESLATKYPIADWKTHILTKNMMYYQTVRADGSYKNYKIFSKMLDDFDRQDVVDLYSLVKESIRMEQYLTFTDHALWEVIVNGDSVSLVASASAGAEGPIPPKTTEQKLSRKNELKAKSTLMLSIPDEHLLKFHACKDAKSLWEAIKN